MNPVINIGGNHRSAFTQGPIFPKRSHSSASFASSNKSSRNSSPSGTDSPATTKEPDSKPDTPITVSSVDGNINEGLNGLHLLSDAATATGQLVGNGTAAAVDSSQNGVPNSEYNHYGVQHLGECSFDPFAADVDFSQNGATNSEHNQGSAQHPREFSFDPSAVVSGGVDDKKSDVTAIDSDSEDGSTSSTESILTLDEFRENVNEFKTDLKTIFDAGINVENEKYINDVFKQLNDFNSSLPDELDENSKTMKDEFNQLLDDVFGYFTEKACKVNLVFFSPEKILTNIARHSMKYSKQDHLLEIIFSVVTKQLEQPLSKDCKDSLNAFLDSFLTQGERDLSEFLESKKSKDPVGPEGDFYEFDGPDLKCALTAFVQTIDYSTSLFTMESRVSKYVHEMLHPEDYDNSKKRKPLSPNQRALYLLLDKFTNCEHVRLSKDRKKLIMYENKQHDPKDFKPSFEDLNKSKPSLKFRSSIL